MFQEFWKAAVAVAAIGAVGSFVIWSLYKQWLKLPIFSRLSPRHQYSLLRLFLIFTFLFATFAIIAYVIVTKKESIENQPVSLSLQRDEGISIPFRIYSVWAPGDTNYQSIAGNLKVSTTPLAAFFEGQPRSNDQLIVSYSPIEEKEALIKSFVVPGEGDRVTLKFTSTNLNLSFDFTAPITITDYKLAQTIASHFAFDEHVSIHSAGPEYHTRIYALMINGKTYNLQHGTLKELGVSNGDRVKVKVLWVRSVYCTGAGWVYDKDGNLISSPKTTFPPWMEL